MGPVWLNARRMAISFGLAVLAGCVVQSPPYYEGYGPTMAPPPPPNEVVGAPPVVGEIWLGGFWDWDRDRYRWHPGRWEAPRPGYRWLPHRWDREGQHWQHHGGRWEREH
jgi:hypothetical protein